MSVMSPQVVNYLFLGGSFLLAAVLGMIIIPNILFISYKKHLFDVPDARKVHTTPVPRLGGLSFMPAIIICVFMAVGVGHLVNPCHTAECMEAIVDLLFLFAGLTMLYLIGEADDLVGVGYRYKFLVQIAAACLIVLSGNWLSTLAGFLGVETIPAWIGIPLTIVVITYITNAINLIDGIDGLASGLCCIALGVLSTILMTKGEYIYALVGLVTFGIVVPFWFYNVFGNEMKGHKLFMGDAGSLTLGFILSFLVLRLSDISSPENGYRSMILAFSTLIVPLFDVVRVVLHRLRKGRNPFLPDKNHLHHKLVRTGMRTRWVLVTIVCIAVFFIVFNSLLATHVNVTVLVGMDVVIWTLMHLYINKKIIYPQFPASPVTSKTALIKETRESIQK